MNDLKKYYIETIFTNPKKMMTDGIYFSGIEGEGEYKEWYNNQILKIHCYFKNKVIDGDYKEWHDDGDLAIHCWFEGGKREGEFRSWHMGEAPQKWFKNNIKTDFPENVILKDDSILAGNGKYYPDAGVARK